MEKRPFRFFVNDEGIYEGPAVWDGHLALSFLQEGNLTSLGSLEKVTGDVSLYGLPRLKDLGKLKEVCGYLDLGACSSLLNLGSLEKVGTRLFMTKNLNIKSLGGLKEVGEKVEVDSLILEDYGQLKRTEIIITNFRSAPPFGVTFDRIMGLSPENIYFSRGDSSLDALGFLHNSLGYAEYWGLYNRYTTCPLTDLAQEKIDAHILFKGLIAKRFKGGM